MNLKPQDILVLLKLVALGRQDWAYNRLAVELGMSSSEVHSAVKRALSASLALQKEDRIVPNIRNLEEFLVHGLRYVFVPERGQMSRGMLTAHAGPPLDGSFVPDSEPPPVWPSAEGEDRGIAFSPLYKSAPEAARRDPLLYELLVLVDAIRGGRARERDIAKKELKKRLSTMTRKGVEPVMSDRDRLVIGGVLHISRAALRNLAQRYHIRRMVLFGSAARGELRPDSDIDLLVEFEESAAPSLGGMVEIQDAFSRLFEGRKVDMATSAILKNPYRQRAIEQDMEELYAA
ncbi:MAG: nucleotidyltransferase domain-containing protein [Gammaproteobacteria bacterium]|nr:nucleotidyltransferase domain-containing protein [Gammaproteobacteria bacterium]